MSRQPTSTTEDLIGARQDEDIASSEVVTSALAFLAGLTHTEPVVASQDIWEDAATPHFVQTGRVLDASMLMERDHI